MPEQIIRRILRLERYEILEQAFDENALSLTIWIRQNPKDPFHTCGAAGWEFVNSTASVSEGFATRNIRAVIRRGRGYRDHEYIILKVQKNTAVVRQAKAA